MTTDSLAVKTESLVWATLSTVVMVPIGVQSRSIIREFRNMLLSFGADLPVLTAAVISHRVLVWLTLLVLLGAQAALLIRLMITRRPAVLRSFWWITWGNVGLLLVLLVALYLPMFKLGAVV